MTTNNETSTPTAPEKVINDTSNIDVASKEKTANAEAPPVVKSSVVKEEKGITPAKPVKDVKPSKQSKSNKYFNEDDLVASLIKTKESTPANVAGDSNGEEKERTLSYNSLKDKLGFDFNDEDDLVSRFKSNAQSPSLNSKKIKEITTDIKNVERFISLSDEELIEHKLINIDGLKPETAKKRVQTILDRDGEEEISYQAEILRNQANGWVNELNKELDTILDSPEHGDLSLSKMFDSLEKEKEIFGIPAKTFEEEISALKNANYKSLSEALPNDQLARAILIGHNFDKFKGIIEEEAFTRGFNRGWKQVEDKLLNKSNTQEGNKGRQFIPNGDMKKPDLDRVDSFLRQQRGQ